METPPGATVLTKIAGNAANDVTIEQLLGAAGYINFPHLDIVIGDDNSRAPWDDPAARPPATGIATEIYDNGAPAGSKLYDIGPNPYSGAADDSMVEEVLSFCKEMMERPIVLEAFKQIKDLSAQDDENDRRNGGLKNRCLNLAIDRSSCFFSLHLPGGPIDHVQSLDLAAC